MNQGQVLRTLAAHIDERPDNDNCTMRVMSKMTGDKGWRMTEPPEILARAAEEFVRRASPYWYTRYMRIPEHASAGMVALMHDCFGGMRTPEGGYYHRSMKQFLLQLADLADVEAATGVKHQPPFFEGLGNDAAESVTYTFAGHGVDFIVLDEVSSFGGSEGSGWTGANPASHQGHTPAQRDAQYRAVQAYDRMLRSVLESPHWGGAIQIKHHHGLSDYCSLTV